jgi:hypothetical protein
MRIQAILIREFNQQDGEENQEIVVVRIKEEGKGEKKN